MSSSPPDGFEVRRPALADAEAVCAVMKAAEEAAIGYSEATPEDLVREWELALDHDAWLVVAPDGRPAAYATLSSRKDEPVADGYVHPDFQRLSLGRLIVRLTEDAAAGASAIRNTVLGDDENACTLLESQGYRVVRRFWRMVADLDEPPPEPRWPDGLTAAPFEAADARAFHAALTDAFSEEWDFTPEDFDDWKRRRLDEDADRSLWTVVRDGDEVAATSICDPRRFDMAWIASIGVRRRWRRRGIGFALLQRAFGQFYGRGERRVGLGVDSQNPTGATRLYERAGMRVAWQGAIYEKPLRHG